MVVIVNKSDLLPVSSPTPQMKRWVFGLFKAHHINVHFFSPIHPL